MASGTQPNRPADTHRPTTEQIDEKYSEVDPDDVSEDAIDYLEHDPRTETEKLTEQVADGRTDREPR